MWKFGVTFATGIMVSLFAGQAQAVPTCGPAGSLPGDTITVPGPTTVVPGSTLSVAGTCIEAGDKIFGNFAGTGGTGAAAVSFTFLHPFGNVTIGISDTTTGIATLTYQVAVSPAGLALGWRIDDLTKDFTLNQASSSGVAASATLTGVTIPPTIPPVANPQGSGNPFTCIRHDPAAAGDNCPETATFDPVTSLEIDETITPGANSIVTGLTDTISQTVPEPASLALLGTGLLGLGLLRRRRR